MKLSAVAHEALTTMAAHPPERPCVLYSTRSGPSLFRHEQPWLAVPQREVDRLVGWGLLVPTLADGPGERVAYWTINDLGRRMVSTILPVPARSRRQRAERTTP